MYKLLTPPRIKVKVPQALNMYPRASSKYNV